MQLLRVNVDPDKLWATREELGERYQSWAGRGLTDKVLEYEVPPACEPLGPHNKLIVANGLLAGTRVSSTGRLSVGAKSPLTGGIKESNAGGIAGDFMARLGLRAIVVEGSPRPEALFLLKVGPETAEVLPAGEYRGLGTYALCDRLYERFGKKVAIICIGQAGEHRLAAAGVAINDFDGSPSRYAGRGGMGAVMGAKGLKAIILEDVRPPAPIQNPVAFRQAFKRFNEVLLDNEGARVTYPQYGTASMLDKIHKLGGVPTRNFSQGHFPEHFPTLSAAALRAKMLERGGEGTPTHTCMPGCVVRCSNVFADALGKAIVSPLEYENIVLLGPNLGIFDVDEIAHLNYKCNDYGLDTIESGGAIGVAMEGGLATFGDYEAAARLLDEVAVGTVPGRVIGSGAVETGRVLGVSRVAAVKGQSMPAYDPRAVQGNGVTYATAPMGADHTCGMTVAAKVDHSLPDGQIQASRAAQLAGTAFDAIGICSFASQPFRAQPQPLIDLINAVHGTTYTTDWIVETSKEMLRIERAFNKAAGFTAAHDRLPEFMRTEPLPPIGSVFGVEQEELDRFYDSIS